MQIDSLEKIPPALNKAINKEQIDFIVYAKGKPLLSGYTGFFLFFGSFWIVLGVYFFTLVFFELLSVQNKVNSSALTISSIIGPITMLFIGIIILGIAIYKHYRKREYFVGTSTYLFQYRKSTVISTHWSRFATNMLVEQEGNYGYLTLIPKGPYGSWNKNENKRLKQNLINMTNIPNIYHVEKCCRKRIAENV